MVYLDCGGSHMTIYVCQDSKNCKPKRVNFFACRLYLNKLDINKKFPEDRIMDDKPLLVKSFHNISD